MFCILVISENNNNTGLFCTLPALISRFFFKWTEIKFILSRDKQKHLTFYSKFIPVLLQNTVKKWEKYRYYSWPRMLGDWKWRPKMLSNSAILCYTFWAGVSLPYIEFTGQAWMARIRRANPRNLDNSCVCSEHFTPDCFEEHGYRSRARLRPNSVPSIFPRSKPTTPRTTNDRSHENTNALWTS